MTKEAARKCSHCGNNGHNSRTCKEKEGLMLFGVKILKKKRDESMNKSISMVNLHSSNVEQNHGDFGYLSDGPIHSNRGGNERKKGIPWTEEEHRTFLAGLEKLGKGDWRGISRNFVPTRSPTQVASHAQKYFLRQSMSTKKRRSSLFDVAITKPASEPQVAPASPLKGTNDVPKQDSTSAQIATQVASQGLEAPPIKPMVPASSIPNFHPVPYMEKIYGGMVNYPMANVFPPISFIPVMNFPNQGYACMPKFHNDLTTCASTPSQPSCNQLPISVPHSTSQADPGTSSTIDTDLHLSTTPYRPHNQTKMSSQTSNFGGCIRVV